MDAGGDHGSAAKGSAIDLEVAGPGPVSCCFPFPSLFFTMCSSLPTVPPREQQALPAWYPFESHRGSPRYQPELDSPLFE